MSICSPPISPTLLYPAQAIRSVSRQSLWRACLIVYLRQAARRAEENAVPKESNGWAHPLVRCFCLCFCYGLLRLLLRLLLRCLNILQKNRSQNGRPATSKMGSPQPVSTSNNNIAPTQWKSNTPNNVCCRCCILCCARCCIHGADRGANFGAVFVSLCYVLCRVLWYSTSRQERFCIDVFRCLWYFHIRSPALACRTLMCGSPALRKEKVVSPGGVFFLW